MKNNKGFGVIGIILIIVGVLVVGGGVYYLTTNNSEIDNKIVVTNFNECIEAGNLAMESYPRQCRHGDETFTEVLDDDTTASPRFGVVYPPYPNNVNSLGGGLIIDSSNNTTGYGIERVQTPDGYELWLNRINKRNNDVVLNYTALDSISIQSNEMSSYIYLGLCGKKDTTSSNGDVVRDYTIVVLLDANEFYSKGSAPALRVWKANLKSEKFENYSPSGISCINEEIN